jgi:hypothetical protein
MKHQTLEDALNGSSLYKKIDSGSIAGPGWF